jgi:membrane-associated protein
MVLLGINFTHLIQTFGPSAVFAVLFAESALIFFLPGDSFLFVVGVMASQHIISFWAAIILGLVGAILGSNLGYYLGKKFDQAILNSPKKWMFKKEHVDKVHHYFQKYGAFTIVIAWFVPGVRTVATIAAGVGTMKYRTFFIYNALGAAFWLFLITTLGYFLGKSVTNIDAYILPIALLIIVLSVIPGLIGYWQHKKSSKASGSAKQS